MRAYGILGLKVTCILILCSFREEVQRISAGGTLRCRLWYWLVGEQQDFPSSLHASIFSNVRPLLTGPGVCRLRRHGAHALSPLSIGFPVVSVFSVVINEMSGRGGVEEIV